MSSRLPRIAGDANKYSRGSLLVLAGSKRYPGAGVLAAMAAARTGAGYVSLATPSPAATVARCHLLSVPVIAAVATRSPRYPTGTFAPDALLAIISEMRHIDAIVCGPGILVSPATRAFVFSVISFARQQEIPLLLDADALNALARKGEPAPESAKEALQHERLLQATKCLFKASSGPDSSAIILTPHAGELALLCAAFAVADAAELAEKLNSIIVAKADTTLIASSQQSLKLAPGTPALAKAGTGDVLSGIIGSLLAQGLGAWNAAALGVELHGAAGRSAEQSLGTHAVMAEDVIAALPEVMRAQAQISN